MPWQLAPTSPTPLARHHLWLLEKPAPGTLHKRVWLVACMAALEAMDYGWRCLWVHCRSDSWPDPGQRYLDENLPGPANIRDLITAEVLAARDTEVAAVAGAAVTRFWCNLQDFVNLALLEAYPVGPTHPFVCLQGTSLVLHMLMMDTPQGGAGG